MRIAIALSGGVDSSVAALLLTRCFPTTADLAALLNSPSAAVPEPDVLHQALRSRTPWSSVAASRTSTPLPPAEPVTYTPFFFRCWDEMAEGCSVSSCRSAMAYAERVAHALDLLPPSRAIQVLPLEADFADRCFDPLLCSYRAGKTFHIDVLCNEHIKCGVAWERLQQQGFSGLATGHYARVLPMSSSGVMPLANREPLGAAVPALLQKPLTADSDSLNDQTLFLARVSASVLPSLAFPLGYLVSSKRQVRRLASDFGLGLVAEKPTSTGICMVGKTRSAAAAGGGSSRTNLSFLHFLHEHIGVPHEAAEREGETPPLHDEQQLPAPTVFEMAETGQQLCPSGFHWSEETRHLISKVYHNVLPAFVLTEGQKVVYQAKSQARNRRGDAAKIVTQSLYVSAKYLHSCSTPSSDVRLLSKVQLVKGPYHPALMKQEVTLTKFRCVLKEPFLSNEMGCHRLANCMCAFRHHGQLQYADLTWPHGSNPDGADESSHSRSEECEAMVRFRAPVRTPSAGQLLVVYIPYRRLQSLLRAELSDCECGAEECQVPFLSGTEPVWSEMVIVASGWIS